MDGREGLIEVKTTQSSAAAVAGAQTPEGILAADGRDVQAGRMNRDKIDDAVLALLQLTLHDGCRAWKGFDFESMNRLHEKGMIQDPRGKVKSVVLTEEGMKRSRELFRKLFGED